MPVQTRVNLALPVAFAVASQEFLCIATGLRPNTKHSFYVQGVLRPYDAKPVKVDATNSFIDQVSTQASAIQYSGTVPYQAASFGSLGDQLVSNEQGRLAFMWYFEDGDLQELQSDSAYYNASQLNALMYGKLAGAAPSPLFGVGNVQTMHPTLGLVSVAGVRVIELKAPNSYAGFQVYIVTGGSVTTPWNGHDTTADRT